MQNEKTMNMKNFKLLLLLGTALCLAACDFTPKPSPDVPADPVVIVQDSPIVEKEAVVYDKPFEWDFDLMWDIFMVVSENGWGLYGDEDVQWIVEEAKSVYDTLNKKNRLYVATEVLCPDYYDMVCFQCPEPGKAFVLLTRDESCGACNYHGMAFVCDMNDRTLSEVEWPFPPMGLEEFFEDLSLLDCPKDRLSEMVPIDDCENYRYLFDSDRADVIVECLFIYYAYEERANRLAFDWDGQGFVRKPEADILGTTILEEGFCSIPFGSVIPFEVKGIEMTSKEEVTDEVWSKTYYYHKDGELVMVINPGVEVGSGSMLDFDPDNLFLKSNFMVDTITIYSDRYQTVDSLRVGSSVQEVMDRIDEKVGYAYTEDDHLEVEMRGRTYIFDSEEPDARVKMIRLIKWD